MNNKDIQESLKPLFREQELQRREARNKVILNHINLTDEVLTPEEEKIHAQALEKIVTKQEEYYHDLDAVRKTIIYEKPKLGYWKNLWNAILGR